MKHLTNIFLAVVLGAGPASSAVAATLQSVSGPVLVSQGSGFKPAAGPVQVNPGDQIMAKPGGSAEIVYADGCRVHVEPGSIASVHGVAHHGSINDGHAEASPCAESGQGHSPAVAEGATPYLAGAGIAAIGVAVVVGIAKSKPASP